MFFNSRIVRRISIKIDRVPKPVQMFPVVKPKGLPVDGNRA